MNRQLTITTLDKGSFFIKMNAVLQKAKRDAVSVSLDINGLPAVLTLFKDSQKEPYFSSANKNLLGRVFAQFGLSHRETCDCIDSVATTAKTMAKTLWQTDGKDPQVLYDFLKTTPNFGEGGRVGRRMLKNIPLDELVTAVRQSPKVMALLKSQNQMELIS